MAKLTMPRQDSDPSAEPSFRDRFPRPSFMVLTVAAALVLTPSFGLLAAELRDPQAESARLARDADLALRADLLAQGVVALTAPSPARSRLASLGIEVVLPERTVQLESGATSLSAEPPASGATGRALSTLSIELARYPAAFLARARLARLLLCADLHEGGERIPSLPNYHGTLIVDVDADTPYLRRLVHHEVFHFADYADDDQLSHDPAWLGLNDHYFVYGDGGRFLREPGAGRFTSDLPGFVSRYATSALEEDKAETFALRMVAPAQFAALTAADPTLRAKSSAVEAQLRRLSPALDDAFFRNIDGQ